MFFKGYQGLTYNTDFYALVICFEFIDKSVTLLLFLQASQCFLSSQYFLSDLKVTRLLNQTRVYFVWVFNFSLL